MKKLATLLTLVFTFSLTTQAQKKRPDFTIEQQTILAVKKMVLALNLSEQQQKEVAPILKTQITQKKAFMEKRKAAKKKDIKLTTDEMFALKSKMLDNQILIKNKMRNILNKEQFEKFEKIQARKMMNAKRKIKKYKKKKTEK